MAKFRLYHLILGIVFSFEVQSLSVKSGLSIRQYIVYQWVVGHKFWVDTCAVQLTVVHDIPIIQWSVCLSLLISVEEIGLCVIIHSFALCAGATEIRTYV